MFLADEVKCTLVEHPSANDDDDERGADAKAAGCVTGSGDCSVEDREQRTKQRDAFKKIRHKIERNLHVLNPAVTAVLQLGQEMLGGVEIMDFDSPR